MRMKKSKVQYFFRNALVVCAVGNGTADAGGMARSIQKAKGLSKIFEGRRNREGQDKICDERECEVLF